MDASSALLTDKVAIITGGGNGIGKGIARTFARFGADVVIADRNEPAGQRVADGHHPWLKRHHAARLTSPQSSSTSR